MRVLNDLVQGGKTGSEDVKRPLKFARSLYPRIMDRYLIKLLKPTAYTLLCAIHSRTLPWNKLMEIIPIEDFCGGIGGVDESNGVPYFDGVNIGRMTVRLTLDELANNHFIERFAINESGRTMHAYLPASGYAMLAMVHKGIDFDAVPKPIYDAVYHGSDRNMEKHERLICDAVPGFWDTMNVQ